METETSSSRRPRTWLLVVLGVAVTALVAYWMWPVSAPAPVQTSTRPRANRPGAAASDRVTADDLNVKLEALEAKRADPGEAARNPFRFKPPPAPPPPPKAASLPPPVQTPIGPPPPPPIPPIPLKFMGTVEGPGVKLAALTDCKGFTYSGREGETVDGRYRIVRIQTESIVMEYLNGTGRMTIRKSGECSGAK